jgi:pSer/pThr/pTyr-binding forkhead associated (FHA) protein
MIQGNDSFRLIVRRGPQPNQSYDLAKDLVTLGRDITNDIVINDPEVSRHHLRLTRGAGGFSIEDLGSTNGTFINGQRINSVRPLRPGDLVGLGETVTLVYEAAASQNTIDGTIPNAARNAPQPSQPYQPSQAQPPAPQQSQPQPPQPSSPYAPPSQPAGQSQLQPPYPYSGQSGAQPPQPASPYAPPAQVGPPQGQGYGNMPPNLSATMGNLPVGTNVPAGGQMTGAQSGYSSVSQPYGAPPVPGTGGYAEDPYAIRDEGGNTARNIVLGCVGLSVVCCCITTLGAVAVDQLCLYTSLPIVYDVLRALGYVATC